MFDWRVLAGLPAAGAVAGYIGSLFSDPLKKTINDGRLRRLLRKNLYREIAHNYVGLVMFLAPEKLSILEHRFVENMRDYGHTSVYEYAQKQQEISFGLKEWGTIELIYKYLKKIMDKQEALPDLALLGSSYASIPGKNLISMIEEAALQDELKIRLFSKVSPDISKRLREIKSGKRRKSSEIYEEIDRKAMDDLEAQLAVPRPMPPPIP
jgi:hypothetical protein